MLGAVEPGDLRHKKRIAVGPRINLPDHGGRRAAAGHAGHQPGSAIERETLQRDALRAKPRKLTQGPNQLWGHLTLAISRENQQRSRTYLLRHELEEKERALIGPVQVFEDKQNGSLGPVRSLPFERNGP